MKIKTTLLTTLLAALLLPSLLRAADKPASAAEPRSILMIGNSLTYTWGIPSILEHFAADSNKKLKITTHVTGGRGLFWHWTNPSKPSNLTAHEAIDKGGYDLVILQEFSNGLVKKDSRDGYEKVIPDYIKAIRDKSMKPMLYMAHPTAKEVNADALKPIIEGYSKTADEFKVPCAPVALAFIRCNDKYPKFATQDLQVDRKYAQNKVATHQSPFGSYLAACVLYATIYHQSPVGLTFHAAFDGKTEINIEPADAAIAQQIAWDVYQEYSQKHPANQAAESAAKEKK